MCGLGVVLRSGGGTIPDAWLDLLDARLADRGPDGRGRFRDRIAAAGDQPAIELAMVHRRLSVIDHAGGAQPMVDPPVRTDDSGRITSDSDADTAGPGDHAVPGRLAVVFNGCLYNHRALRARLQSLGHRFRSDHSDTEVLLHGHRAWGPALPQHLEGMYAYALWDRDAGRLELVRDWFGEKPLWMASVQRGDEGLVVAASDPASCGLLVQRFAAESTRPVRSLLGASDGTSAGSNDTPADWAARVLGVGFAHPLAAGGVRAVPPSWPGIPAGGRTRGDRAPGDRADEPAADDRTPRLPDDPEALLQAVDHAIGQAVERRLEADVPLGCFLSGGTDSTLIAAHAKRALGHVRTFTVRFPDPRYDESAHAEAAARTLGTEHHTLDPEPDVAADLDRLVERAGLPLADASILPTHWVSRAARAHVTVCLGGDGGDELFFGYDRYRGAATLARWHGLLRCLPTALGAAPGHHPRGRWRRLGRAAAMARDWPRDGVRSMERVVHGGPLASLWDDAAVPPVVDEVIHPTPADAGPTLRRLDLQHYLPGDLLTKVDVASMTCGLEVRNPMLDRDLVALATTLPVTRLTGGGRTTKPLLRALARPILGADADRPKQGFAIPVDTWIRDDVGGLGSMLGDLLHAADPFGGLPIRAGAARALLADHRDGRRDHGSALFALGVLAAWCRHFPGLAAIDPPA